ncbi:hypothetical protein ACAG26_01420 [Mycobacterium sp. pUA109]|uniref:hypothetical protein n=1 Tax=Mycobacterium sp. pUA109 TaxID=3238982 RepID=UPI00351AECEA
MGRPGRRNPDGICIDVEGAIWYADPAQGTCVRVREGGKTEQVIEFDDCHAYALGGRTLFPVGTQRILTADVDVPA